MTFKGIPELEFCKPKCDASHLQRTIENHHFYCGVCGRRIRNPKDLL